MTPFTPQRKDVERNRRLTIVPNSSWSGFSKGRLSYGDFFVFRDVDDSRKLARCHGQIRPAPDSKDKNTNNKWVILSQVAATSMAYTGERWVDADRVVETIPADRMAPELVAFFERTVDFFKQ